MFFYMKAVLRYIWSFLSFYDKGFNHEGKSVSKPAHKWREKKSLRRREKMWKQEGNKKTDACKERLLSFLVAIFYNEMNCKTSNPAMDGARWFQVSFQSSRNMISWLILC